jgi:hypothetical protein
VILQFGRYLRHGQVADQGHQGPQQSSRRAGDGLQAASSCQHRWHAVNARTSSRSSTVRTAPDRQAADASLKVAQAQGAWLVIVPGEGFGVLYELSEGHALLADALFEQRPWRPVGQRQFTTPK